MTATQVTEITTDKGKMYRFPCIDNPQLWAVELRIACVGDNGKHHAKQFTTAVIHVERQTLVDHGLAPLTPVDAPIPVPAPTTEDLILQLIEHVRVFPESYPHSV